MSSKPLQAPTAAAPAGGNTERILADYGRLVRKRTLIVAGLLLLTCLLYTSDAADE